MPDNDVDGNGRDGGGTAVKLGRKDFQSDQEVRWCPGLRRLLDPRRDAARARRHRREARRTSCSCRASGARRASRTT